MLNYTTKMISEQENWFWLLVCVALREKVFRNILINKHHCAISQLSFKENNLVLHMIA